MHAISEDLKRLNTKLESAQLYVDQKRSKLGHGKMNQVRSPVNLLPATAVVWARIAKKGARWVEVDSRGLFSMRCFTFPTTCSIVGGANFRRPPTPVLLWLVSASRIFVSPYSFHYSLTFRSTCVQVAEHTTAVVGELKSSLVRVTKTFKAVVQQRSANVKAQQERKKECVQKMHV